MKRVFYALMLGLLIPAMTLAQERSAPPRHGLMWHTSGLPAVFPLQVQTRPGRSYYMVLEDDASGASVLAAFIEGGRFFRVLVPPGLFRVHFASGAAWRGEEALFGPGALTQVYDLPEPLGFAVRGLGTKTGHLVDLRDVVSGEMAALRVTPQRVCQTLGLALGPDADRRRDMRRAAPMVPWPYLAGGSVHDWRDPLTGQVRRGPVGLLDDPPRLEVRNRVC